MFNILSNSLLRSFSSFYSASCLPVHILAPPPGSVVLDMCAAPGMKTTQVAAAIKNEGKIFAVERNPKRFETLSRIVESSGATCVTTVNKDVLTCSEKEFPGVEYILVDPSCSGSGIVGRLGFEQSKSNERIENLAGFQIKILRSALTRYPKAKRVVYSTCSTFSEENEDVVRQVLETNSNFKLVPAKKFVNDTWKNFGSSEFGDIGSYCLYAKPNEDFTNGFFVAVFERLEEGEENQFFNTKIYNFKKHMQSQENRKRKQQQQYQEVYGNSNHNNEISYNKDTHDNVDETNENKFDNFNHESNMSLGKKCKKKLVEFTENNNDESPNETMKTKEKKRKKKSKKSEENDIIVNSTKIKNTEDHIDVTNENIFGNFDHESNSSHEKKLIENQNEVTKNDNDKSCNVIINTKQKKKKSKKSEGNDVVNAAKDNDELDNEIINTKGKKKKSKKIENNDINSTEHDEAIGVSQHGGKHKKKKKDKNISEDIAEDNSHISVDLNDEKGTKKRKKSKKLGINDTDGNEIVLKKKKKMS